MSGDAGLAQAFYKNWLKKQSSVLYITNTPDAFSVELEANFKCSVQPFRIDQDGASKLPAHDAVVMLDGYDKLDPQTVGLFLGNCQKQFLSPTGVLFLRVTETDNTLPRFLDILWQFPFFKVAETYLIGNKRDLLLRPITKAPTVCIGMIAKNEERDLPRCLESLEGIADGLVMLDTGSTDKTMEIALEWASKQVAPSRDGGFFHHIYSYHDASEKDEKGDWKLWNFGKARNEYVRVIEGAGFDYVLWMDADDKLLDPKKLRGLVFLDEYVIHGVQIQSGGLKWPHHRLWKTKRGVKYSGWCHEYPGWGGQSSIIHQDINIYHDAAPGNHENSNDRNLRILKREMEAEPNARTAFYLANTYKDRREYAAAVPFYQKRMDFGFGYEDEYWFAVLYKARCERAAKMIDQARKTLTYAISKKPEWAEFWMELSYLETAEGNYDKSIGWALLAKDLPIVPTQLWREKDKYLDQPYRTISWAYGHQKDWDQALRWAELAVPKIGTKDAPWEARIETLKKIKTEATKDKVLWSRPGAIGDVIITLNNIRAYKEANPNVHLVYGTHPSTANHLRELILLAGADEVIVSKDTKNGWGYDWDVQNKRIDLVGYPLSEGYPNKPMKVHLMGYFAKEVGLTSSGTLDLKKIGKPTFDTPYVTLHVQAGWSPYKNWRKERWAEVIERFKLETGAKVLQIGGPDDPVIAACDGHLLGETLMNNLAAMSHATMHLGVDSWSNHATNIHWEGKGQTPAVILWGSTQSSAAGYAHNFNISLGLSCQPCFKEDPKISSVPRGICNLPPDQTYEHPQHQCMMSITPDRVLKKALECWANAQIVQS